MVEVFTNSDYGFPSCTLRQGENGPLDSIWVDRYTLPQVSSKGDDGTVSDKYINGVRSLLASSGVRSLVLLDEVVDVESEGVRRR